MFHRQIAKILRGKATPLQITLACVLGVMLGFVMGLPGAWGLAVLLIAMLVVLNANLLLAGLALAGGKLASLALMPISFQVGRVLLDGPTTGLFRAIVNAPVGALLGFESYVAAGGLLVGAILGAVMAVIVVAIVGGFRRRMARVEEGSELFRKLTSAWWARILIFIFLGKGHGKATYAQLASRKFGNPIRILGVVVVVMLAALVWVAMQFLSEPITTTMTRRGLERITGATVDLQSAIVDPKRGEVSLTGLAMADPGDLSRDLFRAARLSGRIDSRDLLRARIVIDSLVIDEASHGQTRAVPGRRISAAPPTMPPAPEPGEKTLDDYLADATRWKEKLDQAQRVLETVNDVLGERADERIPRPGEQPTERRETLAERLRREVEAKGYVRVFATHLIEGAPTVAVRSIRATGVTTAIDPHRQYTIEGRNLSTHPRLIQEPAAIEATSVDGSISVRIAVPSADSQPATFEFGARGLSVDTTLADLAMGQYRPAQGGTLDARFAGSLAETSCGAINTSLHVTLHDSTITIPGGRSAKLAKLDLPIGIRGSMANPRIRLDGEQLADALTKAGANQLAAEVTKKVEETTEKVREQVEEKARGIIGNILGGGGDRK